MPAIFGKYANGVLDLSLYSKPHTNFDFCVEELNVSVDSSNFEAVRAEVLSTKEIVVNLNEINSLEKIEFNLNLFKENFPQFKWFGKYYGDYEDYFFSPTEVQEFLAECQELHSLVTSEITILTLRKLSYAFTQALEKNLYLGFISD